MSASISFGYHADILAKFPSIHAGMISAQGLINDPSPESLKEHFLGEQQATLARIGDTPLSEIESLAAWRKAFRTFGVNPTKYRSAPEALLRRLTKKGDIPSINTLVDIGNLISIRYALPTAVFDVHALQGGISVHFSNGTERFTPLFQKEVEHPEQGEVVFSDETDLVVARRWCWRQSDESAARAGTTEAVIVVEAQHEDSEADVQAALNDWLEMLDEYSEGESISAMLSPEQPSLSQ